MHSNDSNEAVSAACGHASPHWYVEALLARAQRHRAIRHPYLEALRSGALPHPRRALTDFVHQYLAYSEHFPRYLAATIAQLDDPAHQAELTNNLAEEHGYLDDSARLKLREVGIDPGWVDGTPHPELYRRFLGSIGLDARWLQAHPFCDDALAWRALFLKCCGSAGSATAVGALGLGTEAIVAAVYAPLIESIERYTPVSRRDRVFFDLHCNVDDEHAKALTAIAVDYAAVGEAERRSLWLGALMALSLRASFYDAMFARAREMPHSSAGCE